MWIHQHKNWSEFSWDSAIISTRLANLRFRQGQLLATMESLSLPLKQEANLITQTNDIVKSSAIEGEFLNPAEVRSSIARRLGLEVGGLVPSSRHVDSIVEMMLDVTQRYSQPLTKERLFGWHAALFPSGRSGMHRIAVGEWRGEDAGQMQVVSGPIGRETVHFEAPAANRLESEMRTFLSWFNTEDATDPVLKAGIAHFWFVTIHPFEDGNGRIARAIGDMALARADETSNRFYSLSRQIESERKDYYRQLESQQRSSPDITRWLVWFLGCLSRAIANANMTYDRVLIKARLWERVAQVNINERQKHIINRMLDEDFKGHMNTSKYAKLAKCSNDTALRDIQHLKECGVFIQNPGRGRSTSYRLPDTVEELSSRTGETQSDGTE